MQECGNAADAAIFCHDYCTVQTGTSVNVSPSMKMTEQGQNESYHFARVGSNALIQDDLLSRLEMLIRVLIPVIGIRARIGTRVMRRGVLKVFVGTGHSMYKHIKSPIQIQRTWTDFESEWRRDEETRMGCGRHSSDSRVRWARRSRVHIRRCLFPVGFRGSNRSARMNLFHGIHYYNVV